MLAFLGRPWLDSLDSSVVADIGLVHGMKIFFSFTEPIDVSSALLLLMSVVDENAVRELYGHGKDVVKTSWYDTWTRLATGPVVFSQQSQDACISTEASGVLSTR